eukprot:528232-Amorphochlora_amoeboformis.AAC.1
MGRDHEFRIDDRVEPHRLNFGLRQNRLRMELSFASTGRAGLVSSNRSNLVGRHGSAELKIKFFSDAQNSFCLNTGGSRGRESGLRPKPKRSEVETKYKPLTFTESDILRKTNSLTRKRKPYENSTPSNKRFAIEKISLQPSTMTKVNVSLEYQDSNSSLSPSTTPEVGYKLSEYKISKKEKDTKFMALRAPSPTFKLCLEQKAKIEANKAAAKARLLNSKSHKNISSAPPTPSSSVSPSGVSIKNVVNISNGRVQRTG